MPMTGAGMSAAIKSGIQAIPGINITDAAELQAFCDAVGDAIVSYIQANATVPLGIAVQVNPTSGSGATIAPGTVT